MALCAVCSRALAKRIGVVKNLSDLVGQPLLQDGHAHWETVLRRQSAALPARMLRFNQTALAMDAAAGGQGIALAPYILVAGDVAARRLAVVWQDDQPEAAAFNLVSRAKGKDPARDAVIDWVLAEMARG